MFRQPKETSFYRLTLTFRRVGKEPVENLDHIFLVLQKNDRIYDAKIGRRSYVIRQD